MSKIVLYPANGYDFDAADVAAYLAGLTSGVFSGAEDFPVTAAGGLKVTVGAGRGWVHPSRFTGYSITKREADTLTMPLADPSLPRIDRIVMRYDAGARAASLQVLQGTASSTPTAPAVSRTELIYDLCLAEITRPAGSTAITAANLTDTRADEDVCGVMRDGATGIPTEQLIAQWRAAQADLETQLRAQLAVLNAEIKDGSAYSKTEADAKFALTADKISTALGYDPGDKLKRLERMMNMDGKLVFSGAGVCTGRTTTMAIPSTVDYVEIVSAIPAMGRSSAGWTASSGYGVATSNAIGAASDFGHAKVVRGCSAAVPITSLTMMNDGKLDNYNSIGAKIESTSVSMVSVAFASGGTLSVSGGSSGSQFVVYGYQYL